MTKSKQYRSWMFLLPILALMACMMPGQTQAKMIDGIVAVVDNKIIMDSDLRKKMLELGAPMDSRPAEKQVLELMVEDIVIEKIYKSFGLPPVRDPEAKRAADEMKCSMDTARSYIMKGTLMDMMVRSRVVITDNMIRNYYESHSEYRGKDSVKLRQIMVLPDDKIMQKMLDDLKEGTDIDTKSPEVAAEISTNAKDIGWVSTEDLSDEIVRLIDKANPGDVIGPVMLSGGGTALYHYLEKGIIGTKKLEDVRGEIQKTLEKKYQQEAFNYWLRKMMTQYFIGIYL